MSDRQHGKVHTHGSRTAELVAVSRARHLLRHRPPYIFHDPFAIHFVGERWQSVLRSNLRDAFVSRVLLRKLMPMTTQPLTRARFTEDRLMAAIENGVSQYVILGSGFDTFALRYPKLDVTVFEIDLASTINLKMERLAAAGMELPEQSRLIAIDFERDDLKEKLIAAGYDPAQKSFFSWLGVTYYLTRDAIEETLNHVAQVASPGSEIVFDYLAGTEYLPETERSTSSHLKNYVGKLGEPMISSFDPLKVEEYLNPRGEWAILENDDPSDQQERYVEGRSDVYRLPPLFWCLYLSRRG